MLAVNAWDEDRTTLQKLVVEQRLKQRILVYGQEVAERYGLGGSIPAVLWIDVNGVVVDTDSGYQGRRALDNKTRRLLSRK